MLEGRDDFNFAEEPLAPQNRRQLRFEQFDRDQSAVLQILREKHKGHSTTAKLPLDPVSLTERRNEVLEEIHDHAGWIVVRMWLCSQRRARKGAPPKNVSAGDPSTSYSRIPSGYAGTQKASPPE